jgi:hypothetical protein
MSSHYPIYKPTPPEEAYGIYLLQTVFHLHPQDPHFRISGRIAVPFLSKSGINRLILRNIWQAVDPENIGSLLSPVQFHLVLRLTALAQAGDLGEALAAAFHIRQTPVAAIHFCLKHTLDKILQFAQFEGIEVPSLEQLHHIYTQSRLLPTPALSSSSSITPISVPSQPPVPPTTITDTNTATHNHSETSVPVSLNPSLGGFSSSSSTPRHVATTSIDDAFGELIEVQDAPLPSLGAWSSAVEPVAEAPTLSAGESLEKSADAVPDTSTETEIQFTTSAEGGQEIIPDPFSSETINFVASTISTLPVVVSEEDVDEFGSFGSATPAVLDNPWASPEVSSWTPPEDTFGTLTSVAAPTSTPMTALSDDPFASCEIPATASTTAAEVNMSHENTTSASSTTAASTHVDVDDDPFASCEVPSLAFTSLAVANDDTVMSGQPISEPINDSTFDTFPTSVTPVAGSLHVAANDEFGSFGSALQPSNLNSSGDDPFAVCETPAVLSSNVVLEDEEDFASFTSASAPVVLLPTLNATEESNDMHHDIVERDDESFGDFGGASEPYTVATSDDPFATCDVPKASLTEGIKMDDTFAPMSGSPLQFASVTTSDNNATFGDIPILQTLAAPDVDAFGSFGSAPQAINEQGVDDDPFASCDIPPENEETAEDFASNTCESALIPKVESEDSLVAMFAAEALAEESSTPGVNSTSEAPMVSQVSHISPFPLESAGEFNSHGIASEATPAPESEDLFSTYTSQTPFDAFGSFSNAAMPSSSEDLDDPFAVCNPPASTMSLQNTFVNADLPGNPTQVADPIGEDLPGLTSHMDVSAVYNEDSSDNQVNNNSDMNKPANAPEEETIATNTFEREDKFSTFTGATPFPQIPSIQPNELHEPQDVTTEAASKVADHDVPLQSEILQSHDDFLPTNDEKVNQNLQLETNLSLNEDTSSFNDPFSALGDSNLPKYELPLFQSYDDRKPDAPNEYTIMDTYAEHPSNTLVEDDDDFGDFSDFVQSSTEPVSVQSPFDTDHDPSAAKIVDQDDHTHTNGDAIQSSINDTNVADHAHGGIATTVEGTEQTATSFDDFGDFEAAIETEDANLPKQGDPHHLSVEQVSTDDFDDFGDFSDFESATQLPETNTIPTDGDTNGQVGFASTSSGIGDSMVTHMKKEEEKQRNAIDKERQHYLHTINALSIQIPEVFRLQFGAAKSQVDFAECFESNIGYEGALSEDSKRRCERCISLMNIISGQQSRLASTYWKQAIDVVKSDLKHGSFVFEEALSIPSEERHYVLKDVQCYFYCLAEHVRIVRLIVATIGDILILDSSALFTVDTFASSWRSLAILKDALDVESLWKHIVDMADAMKMSNASFSGDVVDSVVQIRTSSATSTNDRLCYFSLQPIATLQGSSHTTKEITWKKRPFILCIANFLANKCAFYTVN